MKIHLFRLICVVFLLSSCSEYSKVQKGRDMDAKLDMAIKMYDKKQYYKALPLFEELITVFRGTKKAERTYYYYAYTNYYLGDYETAAYDFENFTKTYPNSEFAEECAYMHAYCFYQSSPDYTLDQTNTFKAIAELQLFIDRYPYSQKVEECNKHIDQLRGKLELKYFENAELYYAMDSYKAAITAYKTLLKDFPSTNFREEVMYKIVHASYDLAENSFEEKKQDRYQETIAANQEFVNAYPTSRYRDKSDALAASAQKRLTRMNAKTDLKNLFKQFKP